METPTLNHIIEQLRADVYRTAPITLVGHSPVLEEKVRQLLNQTQETMEAISKFAKRYTTKSYTDIIVERDEDETPTYIYYEVYYHDKFLPIYLGLNPDGEVFCSLFMEQYHSRKQLKYLRRFRNLLRKVFTEFKVRELRKEDAYAHFPEALESIFSETILILK